jgi:hypothetical protein
MVESAAPLDGCHGLGPLGHNSWLPTDEALHFPPAVHVKQEIGILV